MNEYTYKVEDGEFHVEFRAPLLGKPGDKIKLYDFSDNEIWEFREITIHEIDKESKLIECTSNIN